MTLTTREAGILNNSTPDLQNTELGTEVANIQAGIGIVLPTSDPSVAGQLWSNSGVVTVSAG